ncbi:hypothetical protein BDA96_04G130000 [Sorghum bicolor]|uniref:Secreted protein n=1 Tax=Sorghum bicolor TaxID=4558 RepID=A0A921UIC1_SORBI|nr:hypothetical protein BDA96_04G130000 [Sorghum bicolor]
MLQWTYMRLRFLHLNATQSLLWSWVTCRTVISRSKFNFVMFNSPRCAQKGSPQSPSYVVRHNTLHTTHLRYNFY